MYKNWKVVNFYILVAVWFAVLYPAKHCFDHFSSEYFGFKKECTTHQHDSENCEICDFEFDFYLVVPDYNYYLLVKNKPIPYLLKTVTVNSFYIGKHYQLRAPPKSQSPQTPKGRTINV